MNSAAEALDAARERLQGPAPPDRVELECLLGELNDKLDECLAVARALREPGPHAQQLRAIFQRES